MDDKGSDNCKLQAPLSGATIITVRYGVGGVVFLYPSRWSELAGSADLGVLGSREETPGPGSWEAQGSLSPFEVYRDVWGQLWDPLGVKVGRLHTARTRRGPSGASGVHGGRGLRTGSVGQEGRAAPCSP